MAGKFDLGSVYATPGALEIMSQAEALAYVQHHVAGDWGLCDESDAAANEAALVSGERIWSVYVHAGQKIWVITEPVDDEGDRSHTTVLLPDEY